MIIRKYFNFTLQSQFLLSIIVLLCIIGTTMQYSAGGGHWNPYAFSYIIKSIIAIIILFLVYKIDLKIIFLVTDAFYILSLLVLFLVDVIGETRLGAQRWIDLGIFVIQPSEIMKIAIILMLAKHFHKFSISQVGKLRFYIPPIIISILPFVLVFLQPDLGTGVIILSISFTLFYLSGFRTMYFFIISSLLILTLPLIWLLLHDYQKNRILTFINPERDPLGTGYHIIQSKIGIGSGGFTGKGYLSGTQSQLDFLPEKQTDFIFTLLSEEFGFIGGVFLIILYSSIIFIGYQMAVKCQHRFGQMVIVGCITMLFVYVFINIGMVSGLLPVVGVPLPLISYGGTSMVTNMVGFGLILNIDNNKNYS